MGSSPVLATSTTYTFTGSNGTWSVASNWSSNLLPTPSIDAIFNRNAAYTVNFTGPAAAQNLTIRTDKPVFNLAGNTLSLTGLFLGDASGQNGSLTLTGTGAVSPSQRIEVGSAASSTGSLIISGPSLTVSSPTVYAGASGNGGIDVKDGATLDPGNLLIGGVSGSVGSITLETSTANASSINASGYLAVGGSNTAQGGTGTLNIDTNTTVSVAGLTKVWAAGTVNLNGGTLSTATLDTNTTPTHFVWASGTLAITGSAGLTVNAAADPLGRSLTISSGQALLVTNLLKLSTTATEGSAGVTINGIVNSGSTELATTNTGNAIVSLGGTGATWTNSGDFYIGGTNSASGGLASMTVTAGSELDVSGLLKNWNTGGSVDGLRIHGGTVTTGSFDANGNGARFVNNWTAGTFEINDANTTIGTGSPLGTSLTLGSSQALRVVDRASTPTVTGTLTVPSTGTLIVTGGSVYARSLDLGNAGSFGFTGGTITVNGGAMTPKVGTVAVQYSGSGVSNYSNSFDISGSSSTALLSLTGGGTLSTGAYDLFIGHSGNKGVVTVDALGAPVGSAPQLNMTSGTVWVGAGRNAAGTVAGTGTLSLTNGGQASSGSGYDTFIGLSGGSGYASADGANSKLTTGGYLYVGDSGYVSGSTFTASTGILSLTNGGQASSGSGYYTFIGESGGSGYVSADGSNSTLTAGGGLEVGDYGYVSGSTFTAGTGTLSLTNGGQASSGSGYYTFIGESGGSGIVSADGANSKLTTGGYLEVGDYGYVSGSTFTAGTGTLSLTNGGQASSGYDTYIGYQGGKGIVSVAGATLTAGQTLRVGYDKYDATHVSNGALIASSGGSITSNSAIIGAASGIGTVTLTDSGTVWANATTLYIGNDGSGSASANGTGYLGISSGASVAVGGTLGVYSGGRVQFDGGTLSTGSLNIPGGKITMASGHNRALKTGSISIASGGQIDLSDNGLIVDYTGSGTASANTVRGYLQSGFANGAWNGSGIVSSTATARTGLGYWDTSAIGATSFFGQTADATSILVEPVLFGDADMSGTVDSSDFDLLAAKFGASGKFWMDGDFNYDGTVNALDFNALATNYGQSLTSSATTPDSASNMALGAIVPEPGAAISIVVGFGLIRRTRQPMACRAMA